MENPGYVYVLINPSMEGLVKVGKTNKEPNERSLELSKATGVPTPFVVAYYSFFENCSEVETYVHTSLERKGYKVSANKEFFNAPLNEVIETIFEAKRTYGKEKTIVPYNNEKDEGLTFSKKADDFLNALQINNKSQWEEVRNLADAYYYGLGDTIQDYIEALKLYKQAIRLGCPTACLTVGKMYADGEGCNADNQKALEYFKEGVKRGVNKCYAEMAFLFFNNKHIENAQKCWNKYMDNLRLDEKDDKLGSYCYMYLFFTKTLGIQIERKEILSQVKNDILNSANSSLKYAKDKADKAYTQTVLDNIDYINNNL